MKKLYFYIIFILFGIILFLYYNNNETLSIGGSTLNTRQKLLSFNYEWHRYNLIELGNIDGDNIVDLHHHFNEIILSNNFTIIYLGVLKKKPDRSLTGGMLFDTRYFFIFLRGPDFYIKYCKLNSGDITDRFITSFETKGEYNLLVMIN